MEVKLYGASWCPACVRAKRFLDENNFKYTYIDVEDEKNHELVDSKGIRSIPVLEAGDQTLVGFNPDKIKLLYS